jgi:hypothetical protein
MKLRLAAPLAAGLFVAACSSESSDVSISATSAIHGGTVCAPLDYPHALSNAEYYRQFDTDAAAADYLTKIIAQGQLASMSGPDARLKEITQDARLVRLIGEVYDGFKKVFPSDVAGLSTPPRVAIVESSIKNAFALGPGFREDASQRPDQSPWLFIVHTALMNAGGTDSELKGLFAHELGHLILRNYLPEVRQAIRTAYLVGASEDGLIGETQTDVGPVADHVEEILKRQSRVAGIPELGFPVASALGALYPKIIDAMIAGATPAGGTPTQACTDAKTAEAALLAAQIALVPGQPGGNLVPRTPNTAEQAQLDQLSQTLVAKLQACLDPVTNPPNNLSLMALTAGTNNLSEQSLDPNNPDHAKLLSLMLDAEKQADADLSSAPLIDRLIRAQGPIRSELVALHASTEFPVDELRVYDFEEDADDASVRVLRAIGDDPAALGSFLANALMTPDVKTACLADLAAGRPVPFGRFIDTHPASCWRVYHINQLAKAFEACPATPSPERTAPKGSGRASVADRPPRELVEKGYGYGQR